MRCPREQVDLLRIFLASTVDYMRSRFQREIRSELRVYLPILDSQRSCTGGGSSNVDLLVEDDLHVGIFNIFIFIVCRSTVFNTIKVTF